MVLYFFFDLFRFYFIFLLVIFLSMVISLFLNFSYLFHFSILFFYFFFLFHFSISFFYYIFLFHFSIFFFFFYRFFGADYFYNSLFKLHISANNGEAAWILLKEWEERKLSRLPKAPFETLIDFFIKKENFPSALEVIQMYKDNDNYMIDIEIRLLLQVNDINSILNVFRESAILKMPITDNVCIITARKIFQIIETEMKNIENLNEKYSLNEINKMNIEVNLENFNNNALYKNENKTENDDIENKIENKIENNFIENVDNICMKNKTEFTHTIENKINEIDQNSILQSQSICRNRLLDMEEISNNLLYCERGSTKEFCRNIRMWREGGASQKKRMEVHFQFY